MPQAGLIPVCFAIVIALSFSHFQNMIYAQSDFIKDDSSITTSRVGNNVVSVAANIAIQVSNETLKAKEGSTRAAVAGLFNPGVNTLKTLSSGESITKTKVINHINNTTHRSRA